MTFLPLVSRWPHAVLHYEISVSDFTSAWFVNCITKAKLYAYL